MRSLWAVAKNTIAQAVRMKVAVIFIILLLILLPVMSLAMPGDGTLKGRLQTFVSYGLGLTNLLLCLLTIIVSTYTLASDIKERQIYTILTKPIRRFQFLCGKLLGVVLLDMVLLAVFCGVIYGLTVSIPVMSGAGAEEIEGVNNEFFTARAALTPAVVDVSEEVREKYEKLRQLGQLPAQLSPTKVFAELTRQKKLEKRAAAPANELVWEFDNVRPFEPNDRIFVRFKYDVSVNPPDLNVYGRWLVGDYRQYQFGAAEMKTPIYVFDRKDLIRTFHEIVVHADAVASDGYLAVVFQNIPINDTVVIFPLEEGLEVLYKARSFTLNFILAALVIAARLIFLAAFGISVSTWLSFPVAILTCLVIYFTGSMSGFVFESLDFFTESWGRFFNYTLRPVVKLLPQFDQFNPTENMVYARMLSWSFLGYVFGVMVCIKAMILWVLGVVIFTYREVAKITV